MPYAQINYQQKLGNGPYTIAQVGCFLTAFCNLLERFGEPIDPPALNQDFISRQTFLLDPEDGAGVRDDLGYGSVSAFDGSIHVIATGKGAPHDNNSIVKFIYKSVHTGALTTHFCLVVDAAAGTILDSWDGKIKSWNVYGAPVEFATYGKTVPVNVAPAPAPAPSGKKLFLPSAAGTWRVYKLTGPYTVGHEVGKLAPGNYPPGITYDILGSIAPNIYHIHTESFGDVAIYAGADTIAKFVDEAPAEPAPAPAAPQLPPKPANTVYTKLATPLNLVTNKQPTGWWALNFKDDAHATAAAQLPQGTPFRAFGKAQRTDGDKPCYYMIEEDFGQADVTGVPNNNNGVNTVDLSPAPTPPAPEAPAAPAVEPAKPAAEGAEQKIDVKVKSWTEGFKPAEGAYRATADATIKDLEGKLPDTHLGHDQLVHVAGTVTKDGQEYYITVKSHEQKHWYGIPKGILVQVATKENKLVDVPRPAQIAYTVVDDIDKIAADLNKDPEFAKFKSTLTPRGRVVADIAEAEDKIVGVFSKVNLFKRKYK